VTLLLTPDELRDLTGTKQPERQAEPDASWMLAPGLAAERKAQGLRRLTEVRAQKTANPAPVPQAVAERRRESRAALVRHHEAKRRAAQLQRTPLWADMAAIRAVYAEAARLTRSTGTVHHVDHVLPLQGLLVSGLHVHTNLQILTAAENSRKRNRFEP
jgi:hypothetical protein